MSEEEAGGVEVVRCDNCDRANDDYARECSGCGKSLVDE